MNLGFSVLSLRPVLKCYFMVENFQAIMYILLYTICTMNRENQDILAEEGSMKFNCVYYRKETGRMSEFQASLQIRDKASYFIPKLDSPEPRTLGWRELLSVNRYVSLLLLQITKLPPEINHAVLSCSQKLHV